MYEATLTNYGLLPSSVEKCSYISDTSTPGVMVAYNIEQWDSTKHVWTRVLEFAKPEFCTPVPTSMGSTNWGRSWLWPGRSISTGEEATGARGFKKGDTLRFVVVSDVTGASTPRSSHPTPSFTLDEQVLDSETPFRVRH
jgi:hypothetical protein